jgi:hypothetical protein
MTSWRTIYLQTCQVLMEPNGLVLGILTEADFWKICGEVAADFTSKAQLYRRIDNVQLSFGVSDYTVPDQLSQVMTVIADQKAIEQTSGFYRDNYNPSGLSPLGNPQTYQEDQISPKGISVDPAPDFDGNDVVAANDGYGTIADVATNEFGVLAANSGYGTISYQSDGSPFLCPVNAGFGIVEDIVPSTGNLSLLGSVIQGDFSKISMNSTIQYVPDSFTCYLKYGILARIFASDSEMKDLNRANYCNQRYQEGVTIATAAMQGDF